MSGRLLRPRKGESRNPNGIRIYYVCAKLRAEDDRSSDERQLWRSAITQEIIEVQWQRRMLERLDSREARGILGGIELWELEYRETSLRLDRLENKMGWTHPRVQAGESRLEAKFRFW